MAFTLPDLPYATSAFSNRGMGLDFRNRRPDYVSNFLDKLANYAFAEANLDAA